MTGTLQRQSGKTTLTRTTSQGNIPRDREIIGGQEGFKFITIEGANQGRVIGEGQEVEGSEIGSLEIDFLEVEVSEIEISEVGSLVIEVEEDLIDIHNVLYHEAHQLGTHRQGMMIMA